MWEEIEFENGPKWANFRLSWAPDLDLDRGSGHGHYLFFISHGVLPVYQILSKSTKLFVNGRTYGHTDGRTARKLTPILLGRLPKFGSRPNKDSEFLSLESESASTSKYDSDSRNQASQFGWACH